MGFFFEKHRTRTTDIVPMGCCGLVTYGVPTTTNATTIPPPSWTTSNTTKTNGIKFPKEIC